MNLRQLLIGISSAFWLATAVPAGQVVLPAGELSGPNFVIPDTAGQTRGNNLFHSFSQFNLSEGEGATFTGPSNIKNIIARVTGGTASMIDGTIDTTGMPNANFFFINPFGVTFGPHASVNVGGSLAVTTADYIKLADGGRFDARTPANDILTAAPVSAFGFLGPVAAPVAIQGPGGVKPNEPNLAVVPAGQTLAIIAGDIQVANMGLGAPAGRVALVSVASAGEVGLNLDERTSPVDVTAFSQFGNISLSDYSGIDVSGAGAGLILVRAGNLTLDDSFFVAESHDQHGLGVDILVQGALALVNRGVITTTAFGAGNGGDVFLTADSIRLAGGGSRIVATTFSDATGNGGNVVIQANTFEMGGQSTIQMSNAGSGRGGNLTITAGSVVLDAELFAAQIDSTTFNGPAGSITINADTVRVANGAGISSYTYGWSDGGNITIHAHELDIVNGGLIAVSTYQSGAGGKIAITADAVHLDGQDGYFGETGIGAKSSNDNGGRGGTSKSPPVRSLSPTPRRSLPRPVAQAMAAILSSRQATSLSAAARSSAVRVSAPAPAAISPFTPTRSRWRVAR